MAECMVIDASVAAKWFLEDELERDVDLAKRVLGTGLDGILELHAPQIFLYEVCGLLTKACLTRRPQGRGARLEKRDAINHVHRLFDMPVQIHGTTLDEAVEALEMAVVYHKTHADMTYVRLARRLNCQWCTADERFFTVIPSDLPSQHVVRLSELRRS